VIHIAAGPVMKIKVIVHDAEEGGLQFLWQPAGERAQQ
jgi:hypothetical protein